MQYALIISHLVLYTQNNNNNNKFEFYVYQYKDIALRDNIHHSNFEHSKKYIVPVICLIMTFPFLKEKFLALKNCKKFYFLKEAEH